MINNSSKSCCIIGARYKDEINELNALGIDCIKINASFYLENEINSHADILCFKATDNLLYADVGIAGELRLKIKDYSIIPVTGIASPYPDDVKLNVALMGNNLICNRKFMADELTGFCNKNQIKIISTKQGYTKCNLCVVNDKAVITEDSGLASLLKNYQIDVLKIEPGHIELSDTHYGFIGGASGKISQDTMYFSGNLEEHPEHTQIIDFLNKYKIKTIYNKNRKLTDFGGLIML